MKEIIFVGNPNAGKSTLFNALSHSHAHTGNWHGVTVGVSSQKIKTKNDTFLYTDLPGVYSLKGYSMEEKIALSYLNTHQNAILVNVVDVRYLSRSLGLTYGLAKKGLPMVVVLTMCRSFIKQGGRINVKKLSKYLGIPVYTVDAFSKSETKLFNRILQDNIIEKVDSVPFFSSDSNNFIKELNGIYIPQTRKESFAEKICYNKFLCLPLFFFLMTLAFFLTFGKGMPGTVCKNFLETLICDRLAERISVFFPTPAVRALVCDGFLNSAGGVLSFLPQIALLYTFLLFLEESGYMSALAFTADGVFRKLGLNGRAVFCILLGFGCTTQAILATRGFDRKEQQNRTVAALPYISCSAKLPVYLTLLSSFFFNPFFAVVGLYILGVIVSLLVFSLQEKSEMQEFILELPQLQFPNPIFLIKTLLFRLKQFIIKIVTVVTAFTLIVWFVSSFNFRFEYVDVEKSILATLCGGLKYIFYPIGVYDWQTTFALFSGLIAKENVAGLMVMFYPEGLGVSMHTAFSLAIFILFSAPCVSAITASARELGWKTALCNALFQTITAIFAAYATYYILEVKVLLLGLLSLLILIYFLKRFCFERIYRSTGRHLKKFHG